MKKSHLIGVLLLCLFSFNAIAQTQFWSDTFEDAGAPSTGSRTPSVAEFSCNSPATIYFKRTDGTNMAAGGYTGFTGSKYWTAMDIDRGPGCGGQNTISANQSITWSGINITGKSGLSFKGRFGANTAGMFQGLFFNNAANNFVMDFILIEYRINSGAWTKAIGIYPNDATAAGGPFAVDTDGDQLGDGTILTSALTELSANITGTGTTLDIRVNLFVNNGQPASVAFDDFRLFETAACTAPVITGNPPNRSICVNGNTTFTSSATGATAYQWQVNTGSGFTDITNGGVYSNATTNTLTITGATAAMNGYSYRCTAINGTPTCFSNTNSGTLSISNMASSISKTDVLCYGTATGSATVSAPTGTIGSVTYSWAPSGGTSATATGLAMGTYTVTISDAICQITRTVTVNQPAAALSMAYGGSTTITRNTAFSYTFIASSGTPGYTYSTTGTRPNGLNLSSGGVLSGTPTVAGTFNFNVIATDANLCTKSIPVSITVENPLPVILTDFTAKPVSGGVEVSWATASETNSSHFELMHAAENGKFNIISRQEGLGNSSTGKRYSFLHRQPTNGNNYYQLLQLDKNGDSKDYGVKTVYFTSVAKDGVSLYPNPAAHTVTVTFAAKAYSQLQVTNMLGKVVRSQQIDTADTEQRISVEALPTGTYTIILTAKGKRSVHKLIKL